ncbi:glycosyl hydrolase 115 family protein [Olivibacter jilunii]|uniref:glycosyl hydrolase 115 family protein n=1 Tax=Olivibacter jilunii TaxID=985016 RepID=UPI003F137F7B
MALKKKHLWKNRINRLKVSLFIAGLGLMLSSGKSDSPARVSEGVLFARDGITGIYLAGSDVPVVETALSILQDDVQKVFASELRLTPKPDGAQIIAGTAGQHPEIDRLAKTGMIDLTAISGKWEAFLVTTVKDHGQKKIVIAGNDSRGTAYGLLEISRLIGVSPWEWWADAEPAKSEKFRIPDTTIVRWPDVQFRGIFLNDEDWGLNPWSNGTYEPEAKIKEGIDTGKIGKKRTIGPKTYAKIFELLLRLRANTIWPAMHEVTVPFYFVEGNREVAEKYGIYIGSSHCEPLARNSAAEWDIVGKGDYNYLTNKENVLSYWTDRLGELGNSNNIFTIGMRGKHDGPMQGVKTTEEYKDAVSKVIVDQTELLKQYINPDPSKIPQVIIPYKEVLDVYNAGLEVPDYVTLMWCDDNYGYITHFPNGKEQERSGGNGVYYHASYWGRPHDYLWLGTASPALLYQQMKLAYDKGVRKIWILNVGDIKAIEYQTELFLDMAWDIDEVAEGGVKTHLNHWLRREFGRHAADNLLPVMQEYYRLAYIRKPEFMGNTREEERDPAYKIVKDLPWSEKEINERLHAYGNLSSQVEQIGSQLPVNKQDTYFELVQYPVQGAVQLNRKLLYAQLARHGKAEWHQSHVAFDSIVTLTHRYNALNNGKWDGMMDYKPRNLPVFLQVEEKKAVRPLLLYEKPLYTFNGTDYTNGTVKQTPVEGLGYEGKALALQKGTSIAFDLDHLSGDSVRVEMRLLPGHPVQGKQLRFSIALDNMSVREISYETHGRSEEWKENVLRNQAIRKMVFPIEREGRHKLTIGAVDEGVVVDQIMVYGNDEK